MLFVFQTLTDQLTDEELSQGRLYPPLSNIREVSIQMAIKVTHACRRSLCRCLVESDTDDRNSRMSIQNKVSKCCCCFVQVVEFVYSQGMAFRYPEPVDKETYVRSVVWNTSYDSFVPDMYNWPGVSHSPIVD